MNLQRILLNTSTLFRLSSKTNQSHITGYISQVYKFMKYDYHVGVRKKIDAHTHTYTLREREREINMGRRKEA